MGEDVFLFTVGKKSFSMFALAGCILSSDIRKTTTTTTTIDNRSVRQNSHTLTTHTVWISRQDNGNEQKISFNNEMNLREGNNIICFCVKDNKKKADNFDILSVYNVATSQLENAQNVEKWVNEYVPS